MSNETTSSTLSQTLSSNPSQTLSHKTVQQAHQALFDSLPESLRKYLQIHAFTSKVSCIKLQKGAFRSFMAEGGRILKTDNFEIICQDAVNTILNHVVSQDATMRVDARHLYNDYLGIHVYLGTNNVDDLIKWIAAQNGGNQ